MPYVSKAQQRYLESDASPLTPEQKQEFRSATDFAKLPERVGPRSPTHATKHGDGKSHWTKH